MPEPACCRLAFASVLLAVAGCGFVTSDGIPHESSDGWRTGNPADAGLNQLALDQLANDIESGAFPNTHAVLIEHDGTLVYERYFLGTDERWGEPTGERLLGPDTLHDVRSISKSVTSALVGIALEGDFEQAVEKPISEYLAGSTVGEAQRAITLHHVLTMTAGLRWNEMTVPYTDPANDETQLYGATDPAQYVLARPMEFSAGSTWYYSGGLSQAGFRLTVS